MTWHSIPSDDVAEKATFVNAAFIRMVLVEGPVLSVQFDATHTLTMKTPSHAVALGIAARLTAE